jgi:hypothetical protein
MTFNNSICSIPSCKRTARKRLLKISVGKSSSEFHRRPLKWHVCLPFYRICYNSYWYTRLHEYIKFSTNANLRFHEGLFIRISNHHSIFLACFLCEGNYYDIVMLYRVCPSDCRSVYDEHRTTRRFFITRKFDGNMFEWGRHLSKICQLILFKISPKALRQKSKSYPLPTLFVYTLFVKLLERW